MLHRGERPAILGGSIVVALDWDIAPHWPRVVVPDDPGHYRLDWVRGLDLLLLLRRTHPYTHVAAVVRALRDAGANVVAPVALPEYDA
jgi:hypothetical protein